MSLSIVRGPINSCFFTLTILKHLAKDNQINLPWANNHVYNKTGGYLL
jgi:hypothetical protein